MIIHAAFFVCGDLEHPVGTGPALKISVVIPVINEAPLIGDTIQSVWAAGVDQVIVVDGGSIDQTRQIARRHPCEWLESKPGRALQQNVGAAAADGDLILFLHVDTTLPGDAGSQLRNAVTGVRGYGGFRQQIMNQRRIFRWIEYGNARRIRRSGIVYGDQGLFVTRTTWQEHGPFPVEPLMEDYLLSKRLRTSLKPVLLPGPLLVNARRWEQYGAIRQTVRNKLITLGYGLGVSPKRLAAYYRRHDR